MCSARAQERQNRLEHEFEADRSRKEQQSEAERRRERREVDELLRQVRHLEGSAARDRKARADRLRSMRDKRQQRLQEVCKPSPPPRCPASPISNWHALFVGTGVSARVRGVVWRHAGLNARGD